LAFSYGGEAQEVQAGTIAPRYSDRKESEVCLEIARFVSPIFS
jgi:hypothetical protein